MARVVHFEIHAENPKRAVSFYGEAFGWKVMMEMPGDMEYYMVSTGDGPGIDGAIMKRMGPGPNDGAPVNAFVCTLGVVNLDASSVAVQKAGGSLAVPKVAVPQMGWVAYFKDTEGNIFGLWQDDPQAA